MIHTIRTLAAAVACSLVVATAPATHASPPVSGSAVFTTAASASAAASHPSAAARPKVIKGRDKPWRGAGLKVPNRVPGWSWIGARRVDGRIVYRADAFKPKTVKTHTAPKSDASFTKAGSTPRAAWVVSKFGSLRDKAQGAAVEIAVHALLSPKRHGLGKKPTKRRLKAVGGRKGTVARYARLMVADSAKFAGPYRLEVSNGGPVSAGQPATLTARVVSAAGNPVAGVPVIFTRTDGTKTTVKTDESGSSQQVVTATAAGMVNATATELPDTALRIMKPAVKSKKQRKRSSRLVVASPRSGTASADIAVQIKGQPAATVDYTPAKARVAEKFTPTLHVTAGSGPMNVTLYGPFSSEQTAQCAGVAGDTKVARQQTVPVAGPGDYPLTDVTVSSSGFYRWSVATPATGDQEPVAWCGTPFAISRWQPTLTIAQPAETSNLEAFRSFNFAATYKGSYPSGNKGYRVQVSGPFASKGAAVCNGPGAVAQLAGTVAADGTTANTAAFNAGGWFRVTGSVDADVSNDAAAAACGAPFFVAKHQVSTSFIGQGSHFYNGSLYVDLRVKFLGVTAPAASGAQNPVIVGQLHGPFPNAESVDCFSNEYVPARVTKQVDYSTQDFELTLGVPTPGWYVPSSVIYEGPWYLPHIQCGQAYSTG